MTSDDPTLGEAIRRIDRLERAVTDGFRDINTRLENLQYVPMGLFIAELRSRDERIETLEDRAKWLARTVGGALVGVVISMIMAFLSAGGQTP